ncbi:MAG TPA: hypothetical protein HA252_07015 [Candidatus Diapherotrites archaeon]|uniref:Uncharacterized protein n=1 Tax=Candidatus Iainarchaeum sp. TaxID=3101447 RepID=A0A7J4JMJ6_9ARCH|nr:hypothetical protein [Candidatus Diapherotrites archaeon]HIH17127.1 hypothetical protein [Candidatus Diapherotrites archaeon]
MGLKSPYLNRLHRVLSAAHADYLVAPWDASREQRRNLRRRTRIAANVMLAMGELSPAQQRAVNAAREHWTASGFDREHRLSLADAALLRDVAALPSVTLIALKRGQPYDQVERRIRQLMERYQLTLLYFHRALMEQGKG